MPTGINIVTADPPASSHGPVTFTKTGNVDLIFTSQPSWPRGDVLVGNIARLRTPGDVTGPSGVSYGYDYGIKSRDIVLQWGQMADGLLLGGMRKKDFDLNFNESTLAQTAATQSLKNWFYNVTNCGQNSFTYIDPNVISHTVQIMDSALEFYLADTGFYIGTLHLRVEL